MEPDQVPARRLVGEGSAYVLTLTDEDVAVVGFVGGRYAWSEALLSLEVGENHLSESEAWELVEAFESDTEGGHPPFPMLDPECELWAKLRSFWFSIV